jgi:hypothetical protein
MTYNTAYIDVHYALGKAFLYMAQANVVDISYSNENDKIVIQVVVLEGTKLDLVTKASVFSSLPGYAIEIKEMTITKEKFNEHKGDWRPTYYSWLPYLLFSKAEVL